VDLRNLEGKVVPFAPLYAKFQVNRKEFVIISLYDLSDIPPNIPFKGRHQDRLTKLFGETLGFVYRYSAEPGNRVQFVSPGVTKMTGYEPREFTKRKGVSFLDLIYEEDRDRVLATAWDSARTGQTYSCEYRIRNREGEIRWLSDNGRCIPTKLGAPLLIEGFATDITERIMGEETLKESVETMTDVIRHFPLGLFIFSLNCQNQLILLEGNEEAEKQTGIQLPLQVGKSFDELFPRAQKTGITEALVNVVLNQKELDIDHLAYDDNRTSGIFAIHAFPIPGRKLVVGFKRLVDTKRSDIG
jgi:PAS domain S-box-containing protein